MKELGFLGHVKNPEIQIFPDLLNPCIIDIMISSIRAAFDFQTFELMQIFRDSRSVINAN